MDLDTRARQAARSLQESVAASTPDDHDLVVPIRRHRPPARILLTAAAALALVVGGAAVVAGNDTTDDGRAVVAGEGETATTAPEPGPQQLTAGRTDDVDWTMTVGPHEGEPGVPEQCLTASANGSGACIGYTGDGPPPVLDEVLFTGFSASGVGGQAVYGRTSAEVATLRLTGGDLAAEVPTFAAEGFEGRFYASDLADFSGELTVLALDDDGNELARTVETVLPPAPGVGG